MKTQERGNPFRKAFTLLEIMLVVAIISLLLGVAIYKVTGSKITAEIVAAKTDINTISMQLSVYEVNALRPPTTQQGLQALVTAPKTDPKPKQWHRLMKKLPVDPWGNPYRYEYPGKHNTDSFDLSSFGPDRTENTDDDICNWEDDQ